MRTVYIVETSGAYGDDFCIDSVWSTRMLADARVAVLRTARAHVAFPALDIPSVMTFRVDRKRGLPKVNQ